MALRFSLGRDICRQVIHYRTGHVLDRLLVLEAVGGMQGAGAEVVAQSQGVPHFVRGDHGQIVIDEFLAALAGRVDLTPRSQQISGKSCLVGSTLRVVAEAPRIVPRPFLLRKRAAGFGQGTREFLVFPEQGPRKIGAETNARVEQFAGERIGA